MSKEQIMKRDLSPFLPGSVFISSDQQNSVSYSLQLLSHKPGNREASTMLCLVHQSSERLKGEIPESKSHLNHIPYAHL